MAKIDLKKFEIYRQWLSTPPEGREPQTQKELAHQLGKDEMTLVAWKKRIGNIVVLNENEMFMKQVYTQAMKTGATASQMELYAKLKGLLIEKKEQVNVNLTADDYFRIREDARKKASRVSGQPSGDRSVQSKSTILSDKLCMDNKQEHREDSKVATLGIPVHTP